jgi:hypothetical protein
MVEADIFQFILNPAPKPTPQEIEKQRQEEAAKRRQAQENTEVQQVDPKVVEDSIPQELKPKGKQALGKRILDLGKKILQLILPKLTSMVKQYAIGRFEETKALATTPEQIEKVKQLIVCYGATYLEAPSEADELCAMLVLKKKVWACLSEDTDLFVYGCTRVLRYLSLLNHTVVLYDMENILLELGLTQQQFREICILSGTDYNSSDIYCLEKLFILHKEYLKSCKNVSFYEWIEIGCEEYKKINKIFDLSKNNNQLCEFVKENDFQNSAINNTKVREILKEDGFLFYK